jgi:hypothetical protein
VGWSDLALSQTRGDAADFLDRPADQRRRCVLMILTMLFGGVTVFAWLRIAAIMAKASMTSGTWRCQPCQERVCQQARNWDP